MKTPPPHPIEALTAALSDIEATDTISTVGRKLILADSIRLMALEDGVRTSDDPAYIHDMRVATRRIRSALGLLGNYYRPKRVKRLSKALRLLAKRLGAVRDIDVLLLDLKARDREDFAPLIEAAKIQRSKRHKKLVHALNGGQYQKLVDYLSVFALDTDDLLAGAAPLPVEIRHLAPVLLHERLATVRGFDPLFSEEETPDYETLHALRITFKQLRYATLYFSGVLGASAEAFITEIKAVQDHLGRLNDTVVFADYLETHAVSVLDEATLAELVTALEAEAQTLAEGFLPVWNRFNSRTVQKHLADALLVLR